MPNSFRTTIELWKTRKAFADAMEIEPVTASAWWQRDSIPATHWNTVVKAAQAAGHEEVTLELLATIASKKARERAVEPNQVAERDKVA